MSERASPQPSRIGPYKILDCLGEGGMGTVYLAEQKEPVQRKVALKVIKLGMDSKAVVARFEQERQALALMQHDGIAKVYDCGTTESGQPFFAMEYVKGVPLVDYCDQHKLSIQERIALLQQVCSAVQHAHQKGVVHRDLKPGNVLVTQESGKRQIKVIDFGLAKAMGQKLGAQSLFTEKGVIVGTLEYMAPEQADATNADIDTRADVYSLGVMAHEALTGQLPFTRQELIAAGELEMRRILREVDPQKPSTRLSGLRDSVAAVAAQRQTSAAVLLKSLRNDLDWLLLKALAKEPERRYATANALSMDLQRYLDHEPLEAGPPSAGYRLKKLARRYRVQLVTAGLVVATAVTGAFIAVCFALEADAQRTRAVASEEAALLSERQAVASRELAERRAKENEALARAEATAKELAREEARRAEQFASDARRTAEDLEAVVDFQSRQIAGLDVWQLGLALRSSIREGIRQREEGSLGASDVVTGAVADFDRLMVGIDFTGIAVDWLRTGFFAPSMEAVGAVFGDQELLQARMLHVLASTMRELGLSDLAIDAQRRAVAIREKVLGADADQTLDARSNYANMLFDAGDLNGAERELNSVIETSRKTVGDRDRDVLLSQCSLGAVLLASGKLEEAVALLREVARVACEALGPGDQDTLGALSNLSQALGAKGEHAEAVELAREVVVGLRGSGPEARRDLLTALHGLGKLLATQGEVEAAESNLMEALKGLRAEFGLGHPRTLATLDVMIGLQLEQDRLDEASLLVREMAAGSSAASGIPSDPALLAMDRLGVGLMSAGRFDEAIRWLREATEARERIGDPDDRNLMFVLNHLGSALVMSGAFSEARAVLAEALKGLEKSLGAVARDTIICRITLAVVCLRLDEESLASELLQRSVVDTRDSLGDEDPCTLHAIRQLIMMHVQRGRPAAARDALEGWMRTTVLDSSHPNVRAVREMLESLEGG